MILWLVAQRRVHVLCGLRRLGRATEGSDFCLGGISRDDVSLLEVKPFDRIRWWERRRSVGARARMTSGFHR